MQFSLTEERRSEIQGYFEERMGEVKEKTTELFEFLRKYICESSINLFIKWQMISQISMVKVFGKR